MKKVFLILCKEIYFLVLTNPSIYESPVTYRAFFIVYAALLYHLQTLPRIVPIHYR